MPLQKKLYISGIPRLNADYKDETVASIIPKIADMESLDATPSVCAWEHIAQNVWKKCPDSIFHMANLSPQPIE